MKKQKENKNQGDKKPVYKQWWFWLIIIVVIGGAYGSSSSNSPKKVGENGTSSSTSQQTSSTGDEPERTVFSVGDVVAIDKKEVTVTSVERNWESSNMFSKPGEGKEFVRVHVVIENKSDDRISYNPLEWSMEDSSGDIKSHTFAVDDDALESGELAKDGKKVGTIVFEVPLGDEGLKLHYKSSFWSNKEITFNL